MKMAGIWLRDSINGAGRLEEAEKALTALAEAAGITVLTTYRLIGTTGPSVMDHTDAARMFDDVEKGRVQLLITNRETALYRTKSDQDFIKRHLEAHGVTVMLPNELRERGNG